MRIAVVGAGAVGGYLAARLAEAGNRVDVIARGRSLEALRGTGLTIRSPLGDVENLALRVVDAPHGVGPVDVVILAVRSYDVGQALYSVELLVDDNTAVLCVQNGITSVDEAASVLGTDRVLGAVVSLDAISSSPGVVEHRGSDARVVCGEVDGSLSGRVRQLARTLTAAGVDTVATTDIQLEMWRRWMFMCAYSGVTAVSRRNIGEVIADPDLGQAFRSIQLEIVALAKRCSVDLDGADVDSGVSLAREAPRSDEPSSMLEDLEAGRPLEVDALNGHAVRLGRRLGIPTPANELVYAALKPYRMGGTGSSEPPTESVL